MESDPNCWYENQSIRIRYRPTLGLHRKRYSGSKSRYTSATHKVRQLYLTLYTIGSNYMYMCMCASVSAHVGYASVSAHVCLCLCICMPLTLHPFWLLVYYLYCVCLSNSFDRCSCVCDDAILALCCRILSCAVLFFQCYAYSVLLHFVLSCRVLPFFAMYTVHSHFQLCFRQIRSINQGL